MTRRDLFRRVVGALVASRLPLPALAVPARPTGPIGFSGYVRANCGAINELNAVTMREIMPAVVDELSRFAPELAELRRHDVQWWCT